MNVRFRQSYEWSLHGTRAGLPNSVSTGELNAKTWVKEPKGAARYYARLRSRVFHSRFCKITLRTTHIRPHAVWLTSFTKSILPLLQSMPNSWELIMRMPNLLRELHSFILMLKRWLVWSSGRLYLTLGRNVPSLSFVFGPNWSHWSQPRNQRHRVHCNFQLNKETAIKAAFVLRKKIRAFVHISLVNDQCSARVIPKPVKFRCRLIINV